MYLFRIYPSSQARSAEADIDLALCAFNLNPNRRSHVFSPVAFVGYHGTGSNASPEVARARERRGRRSQSRTAWSASSHGSRAGLAARAWTRSSPISPLSTRRPRSGRSRRRYRRDRCRRQMQQQGQRKRKRKHKQLVLSFVGQRQYFIWWRELCGFSPMVLVRTLCVRQATVRLFLFSLEAGGSG